MARRDTILSDRWRVNGDLFGSYAAAVARYVEVRAAGKPVRFEHRQAGRHRFVPVPAHECEVHYAASTLPLGHELRESDRERVRCQRCGSGARWCEYARWSTGKEKGISFGYYCAACWIVPGPSGSTPEQRARGTA